MADADNRKFTNVNFSSDSLKEKATIYAKESLSHVRVSGDDGDDEDEDDD